MKYVRVYESDCFPEEYITTYLNHCEHVANLQDAGFDFEGCIVKQADTIEELCDGYLCFTKSSKNWIVTENYETAKLYAERGCQVNACILTDEGLIYVAKMSEDDELCLL